MDVRERMADRFSPTIYDLGGLGGWPEYSEQDEFVAEIERQVHIYQQLGFHRHENIGMSADKLKDVIMGAIPEFQQIPHWRFDIPLTVFGQIPVDEQAALVGGIYNDIPTQDQSLIFDWQQDPQDYKTPKAVYLTWILDGGLCLGRTVENIREILRTRSYERRGSTLHDGMGLLIVHPEIFVPSRSSHNIDLPGTEIGTDKVPSVRLDAYRSDLSIDVRPIATADPEFGSATCVRKMVIIS